MKLSQLVIIFFSSLIIFIIFSNNTNVVKAGDQFVYSWQSTTIGYSDIQHMYQADTNSLATFFTRKSLQSIRLGIKCGIEKTVLRRDINGELASFQIIDPKIELTQAGQVANCELLQAELTHPVFVETSQQGLMKLIRLDTAISNFSADVIKGILSRLQFVKSAEKTSEWQTVEENTCGVYLADYRRIQSENGGFRFEKKNNGYTRLKVPRKNQSVTDNGYTNISTNASGLVVGISGNERQLVRFSGDTVALSTSVISVMLQSTTKVTHEELASLTTLIHYPNYICMSTLGEASSEDKINRIAYANTLDNDNLSSLIEKTGLHDVKEEENLILKFRALAYLFPDNCKEMGRILETEHPQSFTFRVLSSALGNAETAIAIDALAGVIAKERAEEETVIELLTLLATCETPTEPAINIARELAFSPASTPDMASTAQLALGGMAYNLKQIDLKRSEQLTQFLSVNMNRVKDTVQKIMVLANTGGASVLPVLKSYIENSGISREIRLTAISGLRLMNDSLSINYLNRMINSKDPLIVQGVKEVIAFQKEQFLN